MVVAMVVKRKMQITKNIYRCATLAYMGTMNALAAPLSFASAYRQITQAEKAFVDAYVADLERNAQRNNERISLALYRAIPPDVVIASRGMLDKPLVRAAIVERINDLAAASELTPHRVVKEWMNVGFSSIGDYMQIGEDGQPYFDLTRCTPEQLAAVQSIEIEESGNGLDKGKRKFKFKLHDKLSALEKLGRYMGMLEPDNPHWRNDQARPVNDTAGLPSNASIDDAANRYAALING